MIKQVADIEGEKVAYTEPAINPERLKNTLDGLNAFGRDPLTGGFNRTGYSDPDMAARDWFEARLKRSQYFRSIWTIRWPFNSRRITY